MAEAYSGKSGGESSDELEEKQTKESESEEKSAAKGAYDVFKSDEAMPSAKGAYEVLTTETTTEDDKKGKPKAKLPEDTKPSEVKKEKPPSKQRDTAKQPVAAKAQPTEDVAAALMKGTTALQRWQLAQQQVDQQFDSAYSNLAGDEARLKAAGFSKGKKFSDYFTYNKSLHKLVKSLEDAKKKSSKDVPKLAAKVTAATQHYREKIIQKAETDFGWANAKPAIQPPFWKTLVAALDDVDKWVNS